MAPEDFFSRFGDGLALAVGWLGNGYHWAAVIGGILLATFPVYKFVDGKLTDDVSYAWFLDRVQASGWGARWQRLVCSGLDLLDQWFGPPHSGRAFARCLLLAFFYPFIALLGGFIAGGGFGLLGDRLLTLGWAPWQGTGLVVLSISAMLVLIWFFQLIERVALSHIDRLLHGCVVSGRTRNMISQLIAGAALVSFVYLLFSVVFFVFREHFATVTSLGGLFGFTAILVVLLIVVGVTGTLAISDSVDETVTGRMLIALVGGVALVALLTGGEDVASLVDIVVILMMLPLLNAGLDGLSWWASRGLMRDLFPRTDAPVPGMWRILAHLALDILVAVLALLALAAVLSLGLGLANRFGAEFPWRELVVDGRDHPMTQGLGVTIMLATTLIPTALHLIAALFSLIFPNLWRIWQGVGKDAPALQKSWLLAVSFVSVFTSIALFLGGLVIFFALIRAGFPGAAPLLADMALWIGGWAEGAR